MSKDPRGVAATIVTILLAGVLLPSATAPYSWWPHVLAVNAAPGWTEVTSSRAPPPMAGAMMAYSWKAQRFVLFGGWDAVALNGTWIYDPRNTTWSEVHPAVSPLGRGDGMLVYDGAADTFMLFGGWHEEANETYRRLADTWSFSLAGGTWTERKPVVSPSARSDALVAYDPLADAVLLFGGFDGAAYLGDAWAYSVANNTWYQRDSTLLPPARADGRMVYVDGQDRFILFGGNDFSGPNFTFHHLSDTWSYRWTTNVWTPLAGALNPSARDYPVFAFDPLARLVLLTSGFGDGVILNDLWGFDVSGDAWVNLTPKVSPPGRFAAVGGFDLGMGVLVLFSGLASTGLLADTWHYSYGAVLPSPAVELLNFYVGIGMLATGIALAVLVATLKPRRPRT